VLTLLAWISTAAADNTALSIASDVTPWLLNGYSAIVMLEPKNTPHLRLGAEAWGMRFPEAFIELVPENEGLGWHRDIDAALAIAADFHPAGGGRGWHAGLIVNTMRSTVSRDGYNNQTSFWTTELLPRVGYRWFPLPDRGLFVNPWLGAGLLKQLSEPSAIGGATYTEPLIQPLGTIHVGWRL
jgi:hypothetical protein